MGRLDRYIAWNLLKGWLLVWLIMSAIFSLLAFVDELERTNERYQIPDAILFILYTLPQRSMDLIPVIVLLGTILALASLNKSSEIIAMRAAGVSLLRFLRSVAVPALLLVFALYAVTEFAAAPLYQKAETHKSLMREGKANLLKGKGLWSSRNYRFFNVRTLKHGNVPTEIYLYEFTPDGQLQEFIFAGRAEPRDNRKWRLIDAQRKTLADNRLQTIHRDELDMGPFWSTAELPVLPLSISGMPLTDLYEYSDYLRSTKQAWQSVHQLFWQKVALPLTAGAMVLLATPIGAGLGTQRSSAFGRNLAVGAGAGILFYLASQIIYTGAPLIGIPAEVVGFLPTVLVLAAAGALFHRMR